jgi:hypothetical protein
MGAARKERLQQLCGRYEQNPRCCTKSQGLLTTPLGAHVHSHLLITKDHESVGIQIANKYSEDIRIYFSYHTSPLPAIFTVSPIARTNSPHTLATTPPSDPPPTCSLLRTKSALLACPFPLSTFCRRRCLMRNKNDSRGNNTNNIRKVVNFDVVRYGANEALITAYVVGLGGWTND